MALPFTLQQHQKLLYFYCITGWSSSILFCTSSFTTTSATHIKLWVPFWTLNYKPSTQPYALKPPLLPVTECSLLLNFLTFIETVTTDCYKGIICIPNLYTAPFEHVRQQWPLTQMHCPSRQSKWMTQLLQQEFFSLSYCKTALTKHSNLNRLINKKSSRFSQVCKDMSSQLTKAMWDMKSHSSVRIMIKLDKPDRHPVTGGEGGKS